MPRAGHRIPGVALTLVPLWLVAGAAASAELRSLEMTESGPRVRLEIVAALDAPPAAVFDVITDYDHLDRLHPNLLESRVVGRVDARTVDVYTKVRGCVAVVFCRSLSRVERLTEARPEGLRSEVLPERSDFAYGTVSWRLRGDGGGTVVEYETEVEPEFWVPKLFGRPLLASFMRRTTLEMIDRVEVLARQAAARGEAQAAGSGDAPGPGAADGGRP